ncbi:hypothetical protein KPH14_002693 [Odynerus spinipes]|uniref:Uncharacterized protein n=1 Tax=Odynerus spinipes TaxID=1348599 RepID=A0AAD9VMH9_9HYME|nr:hypothetical protein KPH14_002693 [Odynerus spinipes]
MVLPNSIYGLLDQMGSKSEDPSADGEDSNAQSTNLNSESIDPSTEIADFGCEGLVQFGAKHPGAKTEDARSCECEDHRRVARRSAPYH